MVSRLRRILGNMSSISPEEKPLDANRYATKKTIAQGMLDIALLTANASQLKYILQVGHKHEFYTLMLGLITTSIILQIGVGILFLIIGGLDLNKQNDRQPAVILNDIILIMVFLITTLNVVISGFGIQHTSTGPFTYRFNVLLGIASLISSRININLQENKTKAAWWHHIAVCCITLGVIVDVIKMTFSVDSNFTPDKIVV